MEIEWQQGVVVVACMAIVIYLHRISGYLIGLRLQHIGALRPILEVLPGCAIIAILAPAAVRGDGIELLALLSVVGIMWWNSSVALATVVGLAVLIFSPQL